MNPILSKLRRTLLNFSREYPVLRKVKLIYSSFLREYPALKKIKLVYIFGTIFFFVTIYFSILYNSNLKEKRTQEITSFLSNDQTILLKNYMLNQIKSPYLEYDYIVKDNDTIESILKK